MQVRGGAGGSHPEKTNMGDSCDRGCQWLDLVENILESLNVSGSEVCHAPQRELAVFISTPATALQRGGGDGLWWKPADCWCSHVFVCEGSSYSLTQALVEALTYPGQDSQGDEITKTGSNGCGYIVWVDASLFGTHNHTHHDDTWTRHGNGEALY